ncbi:hypothetical protein [Bacillus horti]|uniref:NIPSNAP domain-containing protein n=1 Tax=Caldalkalibacillus horti TaxID=77523 RepID=A0ABT9W1C6_9BACI|nr:hypothetical protein [Bacillus horti]MDQ0167063.1 hypothetical protein [Bacillus horti]
MYTIFIEYRILNHLKAEFLSTHYQTVQNEARKAGNTYTFLKGTDQADIFVEMLTLDSLEQYEEWKKQLQTDDPAFLWQNIIPYIAGGKHKFHMWAFQKPALSEYT